MDDNLADYRRICINRQRRLERCKKTKSLCNFEDELPTELCDLASGQCTDTSERCGTLSGRRNATNEQCSITSDQCSTSKTNVEQQDTVTVRLRNSNGTKENNVTSNFSCRGDGSGTGDTQKYFDLLREKMISLMENDVYLLQKLLALGDSIQELKNRNKDQDKRLSAGYFYENDNFEDTWSPDPAPLCNSVTRLYVDDEPKENHSMQYFSRKNSVLRIPIPPRSTKRAAVRTRLGTRPSDLPHRLRQVSLVDDSCQTTFEIDCKHKSQSKEAFGSVNSHFSTSSIDSGIPDGSCCGSSTGSLSPTLKK